MPDQSTFSDRLNKIQDRQMAAHPELAPQSDGYAESTPEVKLGSGATVKLAMLGGLGLLLAVGGVFLEDIMGVQVNLAATTARDKGEDPNSTVATSMAAVVEEAPEPEVAPIDVAQLTQLPSAPEGWAKLPLIEAGEEAAVAMAASLGTEQEWVTMAVMDFAEATPSGSNAALYLHPDGRRLAVTLSVLGEAEALGAGDAPKDWIGALIAREETEKTIRQIIEKNALAGVEITNRTIPEKPNSFTFPIGKKFDQKNYLHIAAPLTERVVMRLVGQATPNDAAAIIGAMDRETIMAQLH